MWHIALSIFMKNIYWLHAFISKTNYKNWSLTFLKTRIMFKKTLSCSENRYKYWFCFYWVRVVWNHTKQKKSRLFIKLFYMWRKKVKIDVKIQTLKSFCMVMKQCVFFVLLHHFEFNMGTIKGTMILVEIKRLNSSDKDKTWHTQHRT